MEPVERLVMPLLPLRGLTVFPYMVLHFDVGREKSISAIEKAMVEDQMVFLVSQQDAKTDEPEADEIYEVGTISRVKQLLKLPGDTIRVLVEGVNRGRVVHYTQIEPFFEAEIDSFVDDYDETQTNMEMEALKRHVTAVFEDYVRLSSKVSPETLASVNAVTHPSQLADIIAANILVKVEDKQKVLEAFEPDARLHELIVILQREIEILEIDKRIHSQVKRQIDKSQREYYLREQVKVIQRELGEGDNDEIEEYRQKIIDAKLPEEVNERAVKELDRMSHMSPASAEGAVIRTYLDWILDTPWHNETEDVLDLDMAEKILNEDHYGLDDVKERVLEYLAVRQLTRTMKGPILCFVGPPGVGKTSIAQSVARSLGRKFVRMSLGGVRDEAEIRGHRRTYIGAIPGRIIAGLKQAGTRNPVFLFDEIDKMSHDFRGDPASAMLEVLDAEQNFAFRDHYLELPYDLSRVMFLTTANTTDSIPRPLLDRMEIIYIGGYTQEEKVRIAARHLVPKQMEAHGIEQNALQIPETTLRDIVSMHTREAGVRELERKIATICRKAARRLVESGSKKQIRVSSAGLKKYLGIPRYHFDVVGQKDEIGIVTGLAWTQVGGETLSVEVTPLPGSGKLELTGQLGDVMKESARAGLSYIRSRSELLELSEDFHEKTDIHIHIPEGAIPKDGPSAGVTMVTAMISALTNVAVRHDVAMTGEVTLRGRVLPIGGLKEKALAAHRAGVSKVIIPKDNEKDLEDVPENVRKQLMFVMAENMDEVLVHALKSMPGKLDLQLPPPIRRKRGRPPKAQTAIPAKKRPRKGQLANGDIQS